MICSLGSAQRWRDAAAAQGQIEARMTVERQRLKQVAADTQIAMERSTQAIEMIKSGCIPIYHPETGKRIPMNNTNVVLGNGINKTLPNAKVCNHFQVGWTDEKGVIIPETIYDVAEADMPAYTEIFERIAARNPIPQPKQKSIGESKNEERRSK